MATRPITFDWTRLQQKARAKVSRGIIPLIKSWWVRKYNLPTTHAAFMAATPAVLALEMLEDYDSKRTELLEQIADGSVKRYDAVKILDSYERFLGYKDANAPKIITGDAQTDEWERAIESGEIPEEIFELPKGYKPTKVKTDAWPD